MKNISILFFALLISFSTLAQNSTAAYFMDKVNSASTGSRIDVNSKGDTILVSEYKSGNVKLNSQQSFERYYLGTPYFGNGWYQGTMVLKGGEPVEGLMAYDLVRGSVFYSQNSHSQAIELRPDEFSIKGHNFSKYRDELNGAGNYFYETLVQSEPRLLKLYYCTYTTTKSDVDDGYGSSAANKYEGEYSKKEKYYLVIDNKMVLVTKKKSFLKSLRNHSSAATIHTKSANLNLKKEEDIIKLAAHLGSI